MIRRVVSYVTCCALLAMLAGCAGDARQESASPASVLSEFEFVQNNRVIKPVAGVITLERSFFAIRYTGSAKFPSVFASSNERVKTQFSFLRDPMLAGSGTGLASAPSRLHVDDAPLDVYEGWSPAFEKNWGSIFTQINRDAYAAYRKQLSTEPLLIASGRNYSNFQKAVDGSLVFPVAGLNNERFPNISFKRLYVVLFTDKDPVATAAGFEFNGVRFAPLIIEFAVRL